MVTSILDYLDRAAGLYGARVIYEDPAESVTFEELKARADRIGTALARMDMSKGIVAVYMKKSAAMVSAFLGIVSAGSCYCPLDTMMPAERLELVLRTLRPSAVCVAAELKEELERKGYRGTIILYEDLLGQEPDFGILAGIRRRKIDTDPLYILFTSGSTGVPKGVMLPGRAVIDYIEWVTNRFEFGESDVLGNQTEFFFDLSVQDIYVPLVCGCKTVFLHHSLFVSPGGLIDKLKEKGVTIILWTPSAYGVVANMDGMQRSVPDSLRIAMFCGEVMPCRQLNYWMSRMGKTMFVNLYGPTEAAVASTYYVVGRTFEDGEILPIGIPCENTDILVLDGEDRPVQGKNIGELCIRGSSLALGYYGNQEKTEEVFVQNPCNKIFRERIYRTGDLAYWGEDGNLMYVSRRDFQVKHMGYRIELGEIETIAGLLEGVNECACVYDDGKKRIILYYTGQRWDNRAMKEKLSQKLPQYMIPNRINRLDAMPYTMNGKLDRKSLKERATAQSCGRSK